MFLKALPAGLTDVLAVGALVVFGQTFGVASKDISTAATMLLAIVGFMILYRICQPQLFAITGMSRKCIMLFVVFSIATEPVLRYLTKLIEWLRKQYIKFIKNPIKEFKGKAAD